MTSNRYKFCHEKEVVLIALKIILPKYNPKKSQIQNAKVLII